MIIWYQNMAFTNLLLCVYPETSRSLNALEERYNSVCQTYTTGAVDNVIACYNYLVSIGNNACGLSGDNVQFCSSGNAQITGSNVSGTGSASSSWYV